MPGKLRTFKLEDATVAKLDEIARSLPKGESGLPATRTDALVVVTDEYHARHVRKSPEIL